jgi:phenylalanine-4-hydroxylase
VAWRAEGPAPAAPGLRSAVALLEGPVLRSRGGRATGRPFPGAAVVAFSDAEVPGAGRFALELATGLRIRGFAVGGGEVVDLRGSLGGRPLELPSACLLLASGSLPSVAGGPADPAAWDRWFGEMNAFAEGDAEARARAHKAASLSPAAARLYEEVRALREAAAPADAARLEALGRAARDFPAEWLLREEIEGLRSRILQ